MHTTAASLRALRTVALFATGAAIHGHASPCAQLSGWPRLQRAAQRLAHSRAHAHEKTRQRRPAPQRP
ncbi:hypothetical protein [Thiocystis violacea]|uniref:hypothetical protein n=1 Tax=Thiocystis violacea TaxID=13725 RepID=UPI0019083B9E|nr:hypothetical protein [Thiocystis violacea]MBK1717188.1 hypothetical protein [Thiocystis violacea]